MTDGRLVIGTRRYSSWSLRGWLCVRRAGLSITVETLRLSGTGNTAEIKALSPNGCVPYLEHNGAILWDSLSIAEYCAELAPDLWPTERCARAQARSFAAEMHSGFRALRSTLPMTLGREGCPLPTELSDDVRSDIARINAIWTKQRCQYAQEGPYLFGATFGNVDAMFAPVVLRFLSYAVSGLSQEAQAYMQVIRHHPLMQEWVHDAQQEPKEWQLPQYENIPC